MDGWNIHPDFNYGRCVNQNDETNPHLFEFGAGGLDGRIVTSISYFRPIEQVVRGGSGAAAHSNPAGSVSQRPKPPESRKSFQ